MDYITRNGWTPCLEFAEADQAYVADNFTGAPSLCSLVPTYEVHASDIPRGTAPRAARGTACLLCACWAYLCSRVASCLHWHIITLGPACTGTLEEWSCSHWHLRVQRRARVLTVSAPRRSPPVRRGQQLLRQPLLDVLQAAHVRLQRLVPGAEGDCQLRQVLPDRLRPPGGLRPGAAHTPSRV